MRSKSVVVKPRGLAPYGLTPEEERAMRRRDKMWWRLQRGLLPTFRWPFELVVDVLRMTPSEFVSVLKGEVA